MFYQEFRDEINDRSVKFQQSTDAIFEPRIKMRPVSTRRDIFPCIERRRIVQEPVQEYPKFRIEQAFLSGDGMGPLSGFNIDAESILISRNHKQKNDCFIPNSSSDLYRTPIIVGRQESQEEHALLWHTTASATSTPEFIKKIGNNLFNNDTRSQLRNTK